MSTHKKVEAINTFLVERKMIFTLKVLVTTAVDDILIFVCVYFPEI